MSVMRWSTHPVHRYFDPGGMVGTVKKDCQCVRVVDCVEVDLLHPHRMLVLWCGGMLLTSLCAFWCASGIVLVGFLWSVKISWRKGILEEQDSAVVGVFWPLPSSSPY